MPEPRPSGFDYDSNIEQWQTARSIVRNYGSNGAYAIVRPTLASAAAPNTNRHQAVSRTLSRPSRIRSSPNSNSSAKA